MLVANGLAVYAVDAPRQSAAASSDPQEPSGPSWERFTRGARDCLHRAHREAAELGDEWVEPRHLLLGVLASQAIAIAAFEEGGGEPAELRRALGADPDLKVPSGRVAVNLGSNARAVCYRATTDAASREHRYVEDGHLLLALTDNDSEETALLQAVGLDVDQLRERVENNLPSTGPGTHT